MNSLPMILIFVAMLAMWYFMSRAQKKQQQERQSLLEGMKPGDKVVTIGGLHGVLSEIDNEKRTVIIDCEGIFLEFDRSAIKTVKPGTVVKNDTAETTIEETAKPEETIEEVPTDETKEEK